MLTMLAGNLNRDSDNVALFELGTAFSGSTDKVEERPTLAFGATGNWGESSPFQQAQPVDFYRSRAPSKSCWPNSPPARSTSTPSQSTPDCCPAWLHPGRSARAVIDGLTVGYFGQLHPTEAERRKLKQPVFVGELYLDRLYRQSLRQPAARELSRYQAVRRDFSFIFPDTVKWGAIATALDALAIPELVSFRTERSAPRPEGRARSERPLLPAARHSLSIRDSHSPRRRPAKLFQRNRGGSEAAGGRLRT